MKGMVGGTKRKAKDAALKIMISTETVSVARPYYSKLNYGRSYVKSKFRGFKAPLSPYKIISISPTEVRKLTGRPFPPWRYAERKFGTVSSGNWDRKPPSLSDSNYKGSDAYLYLSEFFTDTIIHKSLRNHFLRGTSWQNTRLIKNVLDLVETTGCAWNCTSREEIRQRCKELDAIFHDIKSNGYTVKKTENRSDTLNPPGELARNHILVDIGRDGEFLLVDGRHRLSMAKILNLDSIPVAVCVRHKKWIDRRDQIYLSGERVNHPDFKEW